MARLRPIAWAGTLQRHAMAPYGAIEISVLAALLSVLQLSAARARTFELGYKNMVLNCIGYGETVWCGSSS